MRSLQPQSQQLTKDLAALRKFGTADVELRHYDPVPLEALQARVLSVIQANAEANGTVFTADPSIIVAEAS